MTNMNLSRAGIKNGNYIDGRFLKKYFCKECKKPISKVSGIYGRGLCHSCGAKNSIRILKNYCCKDCGGLITYTTAFYGEGRCHSCSTIHRWKNKIFKNNVSKHISESKKGKYRGSNNPNWKIELSNIERINRRNLFINEQWIKKVFKRDKYTCQCCKKLGYKLIAHHLEGYHWCKELRFILSNGITLCKKCHDKFHKRFTNFWNTTLQYLEFIYGKKF